MVKTGDLESYRKELARGLTSLQLSELQEVFRVMAEDSRIIGKLADELDLDPDYVKAMAQTMAEKPEFKLRLRGGAVIISLNAQHGVMVAAKNVSSYIDLEKGKVRVQAETDAGTDVSTIYTAAGYLTAVRINEKNKGKVIWEKE